MRAIISCASISPSASSCRICRRVSSASAANGLTSSTGLIGAWRIGSREMATWRAFLPSTASRARTNTQIVSSLPKREAIDPTWGDSTNTILRMPSSCADVAGGTSRLVNSRIVSAGEVTANPRWSSKSTMWRKIITARCHSALEERVPQRLNMLDYRGAQAQRVVEQAVRQQQQLAVEGNAGIALLEALPKGIEVVEQHFSRRSVGRGAAHCRPKPLEHPVAQALRPDLLQARQVHLDIVVLVLGHQRLAEHLEQQPVGARAGWS